MKVCIEYLKDNKKYFRYITDYYNLRKFVTICVMNGYDFVCRKEKK